MCPKGLSNITAGIESSAKPMTHWYNILNKDTFLIRYDIMWENLALSPVGHETLRKLPKLLRLYLFLIIKMTVGKPVFFFIINSWGPFTIQNKQKQFANAETSRS